LVTITPLLRAGFCIKSSSVFHATWYKIGAKVKVEWKGWWYDAKILDVKDGVHLVRYDGYDSLWDEWVPSRRVK
jgi:hypothetical protein